MSRKSPHTGMQAGTASNLSVSAVPSIGVPAQIDSAPIAVRAAAVCPSAIGLPLSVARPWQARRPPRRSHDIGCRAVADPGRIGSLRPGDDRPRDGRASLPPCRWPMATENRAECRPRAPP